MNPPLLLSYLLLMSSYGSAQISDTVQLQIQRSKEFFETSVVDHRYSGQKGNGDAGTLQLYFWADSLEVVFRESGRNSYSGIYNYQVSYGRFNEFTVKTLPVTGEPFYLYGYFPSVTDNRQLYLFVSETQRLWFDRREYVDEHGYLCSLEEE